MAKNFQRVVWNEELANYVTVEILEIFDIGEKGTESPFSSRTANEFVLGNAQPASVSAPYSCFDPEGISEKGNFKIEFFEWNRRTADR